MLMCCPFNICSLKINSKQQLQVHSVEDASWYRHSELCMGQQSLVWVIAFSWKLWVFLFAPVGTLHQCEISLVQRTLKRATLHLCHDLVLERSGTYWYWGLWWHWSHSSVFWCRAEFPLLCTVWEWANRFAQNLPLQLVWLILKVEKEGEAKQSAPVLCFSPSCLCSFLCLAVDSSPNELFAFTSPNYRPRCMQFNLDEEPQNNLERC